jgi:nucleolar pre-ribosomal-associated protein 1
VVYVLQLLKAAIPSVSDVPRLPTYTTLLLAHAIRFVFYPQSNLYPVVSRFLLQRPFIDIKDVPMLYGMLWSTSQESKLERNWMLKFLADGMVGSLDWKVLKRRHTWDLLASMFSESHDRVMRNAILSVSDMATQYAQFLALTRSKKDTGQA